MGAVERFWALVDKSGECWPWKGFRNARGYGRYRSKFTHRLAYEFVRGPIPAGLTIDHLCRNTSCARPDHMEVVTRSENARRQNAAVTHCPKGHEYSEANTRRTTRHSDGTVGRSCRTCHLEMSKRSHRKMRALARSLARKPGSAEGG